jgi:hypothetical protein
MPLEQRMTELEREVTELKSELKTWKIVISIVSAVILAFLGYTNVVRIPDETRKQINEKIGEEIDKRVEEIRQKAKLVDTEYQKIIIDHDHAAQLLRIPEIWDALKKKLDNGERVWICLGRNEISALGYIGRKNNELNMAPPSSRPPASSKEEDQEWINDHSWVIRSIRLQPWP